MIALAASLLAPPAKAAPAPTVVSGKVLAADGRPLPRAHVRLRVPGAPEPVLTLQAAADGTFRFDAAVRGLCIVIFSGASSELERLPVLLDGRPLALEVRLRGLSYRKKIDAPRVIGDFNKFDFESGRPMTRQADGRFTLELPSDKPTLGYQLLGVATGERSVNGTHADDHERDPEGDYISIVKARAGKAQVVFDPRLLARAPGTARVTSPRADVVLAHDTFAEVARSLEATGEKLRGLAQGAAGKSFDPGALFTELASRAAALEARAKGEKDAFVRDLLLESALKLGLANRGTSSQGARALCQRVLARLPAASPVWALEPELPARAVSALEPAAGKAYFEAVLAARPDRNGRGALLFAAIRDAHFGKRDAELRALYDRFMKDYADLEIAAQVKRLSPDHNVVVGKPVPAFSVPSLDGGAALSDASLRGKPYLLQFWATWCQPCVAEMEHLHKLQERFGKQGFSIVSLPVDGAPDEVRKFRKGAWKMPWRHAHLAGGLDSPVAARFDVFAIPRLVLVDRTGRVIATDDTLRIPGALETIVAGLTDGH